MNLASLELTTEGMAALSMLLTCSAGYWVVSYILSLRPKKPASKAKEKPDEDDDSAD